LIEGSGRVLAVDLGTVRVGLALSDPLRITGQPMGFLLRRALRDDLAALTDLVKANDVATVVVGHPLLMSGIAGVRALDAQVFAERLSAEGVCSVVLWDERLTTVQAERALLEGNVSRRKRKKVVDAAAAALMLQSWLDGQQEGDSYPFQKR
jgi:putative Holliday junction resolvase